MAVGTSVAVLRDIQTLFDTGTASGLSDRQLLERFASRGDASAEAAFEVLVLRHGPMVLRVCHNVLGDSADAQDAFQATFLVLVRRRGSIRGLDSVGGWLYGVACRVAARARVEAVRRRAVEQRAALRVVEAVDPSEGGESDGVEFGPIIQEEVRRLPEKYRAVVVLCYWQGSTQEQAAEQLGCPLGTIRSRLARARDLLRRRLIRRGLVPLAGIVVAALDGATASAGALRRFSVPSQLVRSTIRAASQVAAGQATSQVASGVVASLVQQFLWSVTMSKVSSVVVGVALVGLMGYGTRVAVSSGQIAQAQGKVGKTAVLPDQENAPEGSSIVYSPIRGQTTIIKKLVPDKSIVRKGWVVCELDSASLKDQLVNQKITTQSAKANFENAKLTREVAEIAVVEYKEGILASETKEIQGEIEIAEAEQDLAELELAEAKAVVGNNRVPLKRAQVADLRAKNALAKARSRLKVLTQYTAPKTIKELQTEVEKARSNELGMKARWEEQLSTAQKLERQIANCEIKAPHHGTVIYANRLGSPMEIGTIVREGQILFEIVPESGVKPVRP
jgi:RNA polymerase sigma factor (sigma-70 family)